MVRTQSLPGRHVLNRPSYTALSLCPVMKTMRRASAAEPVKSERPRRELLVLSESGAMVPARTHTTAVLIPCPDSEKMAIIDMFVIVGPWRAKERGGPRAKDRLLSVARLQGARDRSEKGCAIERDMAGSACLPSVCELHGAKG